MSKDPIGRRSSAFFLLGILLAALCGSAIAAERAAPAVQRVQVHPNHYAAGGNQFVELERLEDWVKSTGTHSLEFHTCMWTGNDRLAAAMERFQHAYLDVRWVAPGESGCPAVAVDKAARAP